MMMGSRQRILVVEDDAAIRRGLVDAMRVAGFEVFEAATAPAGMEAATGLECDLVLLDLLLPGGDGLGVLRKIREVRPTLPVIILTARGDEADRVKGLGLGADDYVVKPFSVLELTARVRAVLRRSPGRPLDVSRVKFAEAGVEVDLARREVRYTQTPGSESPGTRIEELSEKEVDLLRYLASNPGRAVGRDELLGSVWRLEPSGVTTRTIDMHVARLREKLRDDGARPRMLLTVRGKGYMLGDGAVVEGPGGAGS